MREIDFEGGKRDILSGEGRGETLVNVITRRLSRRDLVKAGAIASTLVIGGPPRIGTVAAAQTGAADSLSFEPIAPDFGPDVVVPTGYRHAVLLPWGDALFPDLDEVELTQLTPEAQALRVGYNHDFVGFLPLPFGSDNSDHGLLVINHEYTNPELMFGGYLSVNPEFESDRNKSDSDIPEFLTNPTQSIVDTEIEAHGVSIVEVMRGDDGEWTVVTDSQYNRRLTGTTEMIFTGPAAGHDWLKTSVDDTGTVVSGTLNNCSGGLTPWGTYITCEENFNQYFGNLGALDQEDPISVAHARYGLPPEASQRRWKEFQSRFDLSQEPTEPFRFGWTVEVDPYDPTFVPRKHTGLGRFKHEGVSLVVTPSGQVAVYSGDDERFDYVYKFVSSGSYDVEKREANFDLLDEGTLYVARFDEDGSGEWLPLMFGEGSLTEENGFNSQADVLIRTRLAADLLGATKMDRPEDIDFNPVNGRVYMAMTNNTRRATEGHPGVDAANPRPENEFGHIIEVTEDGGDHAATTFAWEIFILCGDPSDESTYFAGFPKEMVSAIANPDNLAIDREGNLWISTDGQPSTLDINDGVYAVPVDGENRGYLRQFFSAVPGAESASLCHTPDNTTLFVSIQHPGEGSHLGDPMTTWPGPSAPPRPALVAIQKIDGGPVGS